MRLVKVSAPAGNGARIIQIAFSVGIKQVSMHQVEQYQAEHEKKIKEIIDIETSTAKAKAFCDELIRADFYRQTDFSISTRQPRSIISGESLSELTVPRVDPAIDIFEELWQFTRITVSLIGRIFIAGCLLAFGLINQQILLIIAGLLFLPILPLLLAIGFGVWTRQWTLAKQGLISFLCTMMLLILAGILVSLFSAPPLKFDEFNSPVIGILISLAVGVAAALANSDDVGKRELIGLAATAQIAVLPVWFGICIIFGFPITDSRDEITMRAVMFAGNALTIIIASLITYILIGATDRSLEKLKT